MKSRRTLVIHDGPHFSDEILATYAMSDDVSVDHIKETAKHLNHIAYQDRRLWIDLVDKYGAVITHWQFNY